MKKSISLLMIFMLIAVFALTGCGNSNNSSSKSNGSNGGGKVNATIWATNINVPILKKAVKTYQKNHPNFNANIVEMANSDIRSKITTGLQAQGQGLPDAALLVDDGVNGYLSNYPNAFVDITKKGFASKHKNDFPNYKIGSISYNGDMYALPLDAGPVGVFYRKDIFQQAGVNPNSIKTWDDYIKAGQTIKAKTGVNMLSYDSTDITVYTILLSELGKGYFNQAGTKTTLGSPDSIKAANIMQEMAKDNILLGTPGWSAWVSSISNSKTATAIAGAWLVGTLEQQVPKQSGKWGVMLLPSFNQGGTRAANQGGSSFVIPKTSKNVDATYNFLQWFTTNYKTQVQVMKGGLFPSYLPVYKDQLFSQPEKYFNNQKVWKLFANEMKNIPSVNYTANDAVARDEAIKMQSKITNGKSVKASLDTAKQDVQNHINH